MADRKIKQLSIFVNNEPGRLAHIVSVLKENGVNMKAFNLAESAEFGILRAIVDDPDQAFAKLKDKDIIVRQTEVIGVLIDDEPGSIFAAADLFGREGINIEYGYAYTGRSAAAFFMRVDDCDRAIEILDKAGIRLITDKEI
jgi:hypothetical protein